MHSRASRVCCGALWAHLRTVMKLDGTVDIITSTATYCMAIALFLQFQFLWAYSFFWFLRPRLCLCSGLWGEGVKIGIGTRLFHTRTTPQSIMTLHRHTTDRQSERHEHEHVVFYFMLCLSTPRAPAR